MMAREPTRKVSRRRSVAKLPLVELRARSATRIELELGQVHHRAADGTRHRDHANATSAADPSSAALINSSLQAMASAREFGLPPAPRRMLESSSELPQDSRDSRPPRTSES
jgi:hypothetical protein